MHPGGTAAITACGLSLITDTKGNGNSQLCVSIDANIMTVECQRFDFSMSDVKSQNPVFILLCERS